MSIISSATLRITENVAKDSVFYGGLTHTRTIIDENKMDKFEANCPNSGIEVWFEYCHRGLGRYPKKYEIIINKYAFDYIIGGTFRRIVNDGDYAYELVVVANEDNDIDLDKGVFVCIYDLGDGSKFIDKINIKIAYIGNIKNETKQSNLYKNLILILFLLLKMSIYQ